jgi:hypothetical protein
MRIAITPAFGDSDKWTFLVEAGDHHYRSGITYASRGLAKAAAERYATRLSQSEFYDFTPARRMEER